MRDVELTERPPHLRRPGTGPRAAAAVKGSTRISGPGIWGSSWAAFLSSSHLRLASELLRVGVDPCPNPAPAAARLSRESWP